MVLTRSGWFLAVVSAALVALMAPEVPNLVRDTAGDSFPEALIAIACLLTLALAWWALLAFALVMTGASSRMVTALTPAFLRRALLAGAAGALVVGPAHANQIAAPDVPRHSVHGLPLPDRPTVTEVVAVQSEIARTVEVQPGDTLWGIASRHLADDAPNARLAAATADWYRTNRDVIGDNPDLIIPGQQLTPPNRKDLP